MTDSERDAYRQWLEQIAPVALWTYAGFIAVLLPAFHFILDAAPGHPPDSLPIRLAAVAVSVAVAVALALHRPLRRFASELQIVNVLPTMLVVDMLVVDSGNHFLYVASAFLIIVAAPQAFYREEYLGLCMAVAFIFQVLYSAHAGVLLTTTNVIVLIIFASGYLLAYIPASLRMRVVRREFIVRLRAQNTAHELAVAEESLKRLARTDALTGLPNRISLMLAIGEALAPGPGCGCAVLFLDLDRFKDVNDTLGHAVGDVLLRVVAGRLSSAVGNAGAVARWGGDEFVVVLPGLTDPGRVSEMAATLSKVFVHPFRVDGYELTVTGTIGISTGPRDGNDAMVLIRNADTAMYRAKENYGAPFLHFEADMHAAATLRHSIANGLREAIAGEQFVLHYQPIVETANARLVGAEALIRWPDAAGNLRQPNSFIGVAEETGLIVGLGTWVLRRACEQLAQWQRGGSMVRLSVNVSARQLLHPDFSLTLRRALESSGANPQQLDLEITESTLLTNVDAVLRALRELKAMGVSVTIDDFGTGYSALSYLKQFPVDALKLDARFVSDIEDRQQCAIARSIVEIAHALGMSVTAEGVERPEQLLILAGLRCDLAQGFLLGRPVPNVEFEPAHLAPAS